MLRTIGCLAAWFSIVGVAFAGEPLAPIPERFATADVAETPDFQKHIVPMMGRLGCNGRACHGSFQGAGGLRLSLFGYDFKLDHEALVKGDAPRADLEIPEESLMLQKPLMEVPHKGGRRYAADSWQHHVFLKWIKAGAVGTPEDAIDKVRLEVLPSDIHFSKRGETVQLRALAHWSSGIVEDVTPLCRFQTNDDQVAAVSEDGLVTANEAGDTHVVAFYDNAVVPVPVLRPVSELTGERYPAVPTPTQIDRLVVEKLKSLGMVQSEVCTDAEFLRRLSLDLTGSLPDPQEIEAFLADESSDKRAKKIEELMDRPAYAAWWATKLCDYTNNNVDSLNNLLAGNGNAMVASQMWYDWLLKRVRENVSYDKIVEGIVLAKSRNEGESFVDYSKRMSDNFSAKGDAGYAKDDALTLYWARIGFRTPNERALGFAYTFLGMRIQCAECHKHPFDQWSQDDFKQFTGFFDRVRYGQNPADRKQAEQMLADLKVDTDKKNGNEQRRQIQALLAKGETVPFNELFVTPPVVARPNAKNKKDNPKKGNRNPVSSKSARLLDGETFAVSEMDDPRVALMDWLRSPTNRWFSRAFVNRVWSNYFNVGIVSPTDDMSLANPPSNKALLDYLADEFIKHNYDMKWLHREICNSRTYQLSWVPNETNRLDERNFSRSVPRRLPAEAAYDAVALATASSEELAAWKTDLAKRAIAVAGSGARRQYAPGDLGYALSVFGRSTRASNCDCDRSMDASLLQTVFLQNDPAVGQLVEHRGGWLDELAREYTGKPVVQTERAEVDNRKQNENRKALRARLQGLKEKLAKAKTDDNQSQVKQLGQQISQTEKRIAQIRGDKRDDKPSDTGEKGDSTSTDKLGTSPTFDSVKIIREAYLRTVSRPPTEAEIERCQRHLQDSPDLIAGVRGLMWALINTKEFMVNH